MLLSFQDAGRLMFSSTNHAGILLVLLYDLYFVLLLRVET
jgi:hypothetical protein